MRRIPGVPPRWPFRRFDWWRFRGSDLAAKPVGLSKPYSEFGSHPIGGSTSRQVLRVASRAGRPRCCISTLNVTLMSQYTTKYETHFVFDL